MLTDEAGAAWPRQSGLPVLVTPDARAALGAVAAWIYRTDENPATLFAVTGTNGKTSVVYLLYAILSQLGVVAGLTSTAERRIGDVAVTSSLTTPEASELHALLARMREAEVRAVGIEVSAQALTRHRVDGLVFDVVGFTNLSHDHLDDYADFEEYFEAKLELFQPDRSRRGVVTVDTEWGRRIADSSRIPVTTLTSDPARRRRLAHDRDRARPPTNTDFRLDGPDGRSLDDERAAARLVHGRQRRPGDRHARRVGLRPRRHRARPRARRRHRRLHPRPRRAHLRRARPRRLHRLRPQPRRLPQHPRGHPRRPPRAASSWCSAPTATATPPSAHDMGAIAARGADAVVITDFHPRFEDPAAIRAALLAGARDAVPDGELYEVPDPRAAFRAALALAGDGDAILYAGPGHEDYHEVAGVKVPYSARDDARLALQEAGWLMIDMTLAEIAAAIGGELRPGAHGCDGRHRRSPAPSHTDSREVGAGDIFVAKRGEETDGHLFAPAAVENGAALLIVEHALDLAVPRSSSPTPSTRSAPSPPRSSAACARSER